MPIFELRVFAEQKRRQGFLPLTSVSAIGTGCQSIYNICILNYCKLTFEFFKNYIFEKRRQFLNRNVRIPKMHWYRIGTFKSCKDFNVPHRLHIRCELRYINTFYLAAKYECKDKRRDLYLIDFQGILILNFFCSFCTLR